MFKKICSLLLVAAFCLSLAACGGDAHTCSGEKWVTKEEAACEKAGVKEQVCSCGKVVATEAIPATGHSFVKGVCSACGAEDPAYVPGPSEGLLFASNGDGTCQVTGLGECSDKALIIPEASPAGDKVVKIGSNAFKDCTDLISVEIPNTVTRIDDSAFEGCTQLKVVSGCAGLKAIGKRAFRNCSGLVTMSFGNVLFSIEDGAFYGCKSLTGVLLPNTVKILRTGAFRGCEALTEITIPDQMTEIETCAFFGCTALKTVRIGSGVVQIGERAFADCTNLSDITFGENVESIEERAFENCASLTKLDLPESLGSIEDKAFSCCAALTKVTINAPHMLQYEDQFWLCGEVQLCVRDALVEEYKNSYAWQVYIIVGQSSPDVPVGSIGLEFQSNNDGTCVLVGRGSCTDTVIRIPDTSPAGDKVVKIGDNAFSQYCGDITEIIIPSTVTELGRHPFEGCHALTKLEISASVTTGYADMLFDNDLTELTLHCPAVMDWPVDMIVRDADEFYTGITIFVPADLVEAYRAASGWGPFGENIQPIA